MKVRKNVFLAVFSAFIVMNILLVKTVYAEVGNANMASFAFETAYNSQLKYDIKGYFDGNNIYCILPNGVNKSKLVATFTTDGEIQPSVNGVSQASGVTANDFSKDVIYKMNDKSNHTYNVIVKNSNSPTIQIETEGKEPIVSKDSYLTAAMTVTGNSKYTQGLYNGTIKIKGRGNSTWKFEKKPFKIKLDSKSGILGMDPDKEWVLLANYLDKTLIRNSLMFELSQEFGLRYTSDYVSVDLIVNGEYLGNYTLCEQVKIGSSRVNINEDNGYLLEIDNHKDEDVWFYSSLGVPIAVKEPKKITQAKEKYIVNYINEFEAALNSDDFSYNGKRYDDYIDVSSFVNWYIVNEISKNVDSKGYSSIYLYMDKDGELAIGPVWDYDRAFGNVTYDGCDNPQGWWVKEGTWYSRMFKDPKFVSRVKNRYEEMKPVINNIVNMINKQETGVRDSRILNYMRWSVSSKIDINNTSGTGSYDSELNYLKNWTTNRISWMSGEMKKPEHQSLIGNTRYETAVLLSKTEFPKADTVLIVNGNAIVDGLTAAPLASYTNSPILLTGTDSIPDSTVAEIKRLGAKKAIIIGGKTVVTGDVESKLKSIGVSSVSRLGGATRYETSLLIAKHMDSNYQDVSSLFICGGTGEADAMSIASIASERRTPIILVPKDDVTSETYSWIKSESINDAYVVGGESVVSGSVLSKLNKIISGDISGNRIYGSDRYATNANVINKFYGTRMNSVYVSKGLVLVDALTAGPIAARSSSPVVLTYDDLTQDQINVFNNRNINVIIQSGGGVSQKSIDTLDRTVNQ